jgi:tRNA (guanine37-N1)-methyltransferase
MTGRAWRVPRSEAESVRQELIAGGWLAEDRAVRRTEEFVLFPLRGDPDPAPAGGSLVEVDLDPRRAVPHSYRDLLHWSPSEEALLPRSFDIVGDVVVVRLPPELLAQGPAVGAALLTFVPGARIVARDDGVHGPERVRTLVPLAGEGSFRTRHRENGFELEVDLATAYFSPRLGREHARVAGEVRAGETVFDLFCGVGPFALTIARQGRARRIVAVDSNPSAIDLLRATAERARLGGSLEPVLGPVEGFLPSAGVADRVVMNLPHGGIKYVAQVATAVAPGGDLHYYEVTERALVPGRPDALCRLLAPTGRFEAGPPRVVHPYSPSSDLLAYTLHRNR